MGIQVAPRHSGQAHAIEAATYPRWSSRRGRRPGSCRVCGGGRRHGAGWRSAGVSEPGRALRFAGARRRGDPPGGRGCTVGRGRRIGSCCGRAGIGGRVRPGDPAQDAVSKYSATMHPRPVISSFAAVSCQCVKIRGLEDPWWRSGRRTRTGDHRPRVGCATGWGELDRGYDWGQNIPTSLYANHELSSTTDPFDLPAHQDQQYGRFG